ncbi:MAG: hypothetical protein ACR2JX_06290 [Mycobacteriales bacterium]
MSLLAAVIVLGSWPRKRVRDQPSRGVGILAPSRSPVRNASIASRELCCR